MIGNSMNKLFTLLAFCFPFVEGFQPTTLVAKTNKAMFALTNMDKRIANLEAEIQHDIAPKKYKSISELWYIDGK
jgi:hypothetical protein